VLEVGEEFNDLIIMSNCVYYTSLGFEQTPEMRGFLGWHMVMYPDLLLDGPTHTSRGITTREPE
jgi:hypothetical protein